VSGVEGPQAGPSGAVVVVSLDLVTRITRPTAATTSQSPDLLELSGRLTRWDCGTHMRTHSSCRNSLELSGAHRADLQLDR